ncbi:MAG: metallopeptidase family protein [Thermoleophilia bacterium]|nr:metallopeptidase family protein [Thermoleophilia bacterium]
MDPARFEQLVGESLAALPEKFFQALENVAIHVADLPGPGQMDEMDEGDPYHLLGLYEGIPLTQRDFGYAGVLPDRITIFRLPILQICRTDEEIREQVLKTVMHELGHYFGMDEDQLSQFE